MTGQKIFTPLSPFIQRFVFPYSSELYSQFFYNYLDNLKDFEAYYSKCETLSSIYKDDRVKVICAKLLKYLETNTINKGDEYDVCKLLNFWVYRWLFDILGTNDEKYIPLVYGQLQLIWSFFIQDKPENKTCVPISELVLHDDWRERKELYDYCVDYSPFNKTIFGYNHRCKEFYKYVESKKPLYEYFKKDCSPDKKDGCPDFYSKCEQYDPEEVLPTLECHQVIIKSRPAAAPSVLQRVNTLSVSDPISEEEDGPKKPFDAPILSGKSNNVGMYGNVLLGVVATSMTSGALYRFTPLGNMLRNRFGWNTNNMRNFNGGDIRLYDYASEPFNPYQGEEHYIGYHPA